MCNVFKINNPNTELHAVTVSTGTARASAKIDFSGILSHNGGSASTNGEYLYLLIGGYKCYTQITSGWLASDIASVIFTKIGDAQSTANNSYPVFASLDAVSAVLHLNAKNSGLNGNYIDVRFNYYDGQDYPTCFGTANGSNVAPSMSTFMVTNSGVGAYADLDDVWAIVDNQQYEYIIQPSIEADALTSIEDELANRYDPLEDLQGQGFTFVRGALASCTTLGNTRNSPHNTIMGCHDSPTGPDEWAAAYGAKAAKYLNDDPARPLHYIKLDEILPPPVVNRFTRAERDVLLTDGIATYRVDFNGNVVIDRAITTYQTNSIGISDASYLDVNTLATISEIRYQFKARMLTRFIIPRMKLADNSFPVFPGSNVVTPSVIRSEIIALFSQLRDRGLIENLEEFKTNLIVERDETDKSRVNILLPADLINQFRIAASKLQFIL
jgi:phage tail sheath gpL-like